MEKIKITKPKDKITIDVETAELINLFEEQLSKKENDLNHYVLAITGERSIIELDSLERIYKSAGWARVKCYNNMTSGLCVLSLSGVILDEKLEDSISEEKKEVEQVIYQS